MSSRRRQAGTDGADPGWLEVGASQRLGSGQREVRLRMSGAVRNAQPCAWHVCSSTVHWIGPPSVWNARWENGARTRASGCSSLSPSCSRWNASISHCSNCRSKCTWMGIRRVPHMSMTESSCVAVACIPIHRNDGRAWAQRSRRGIATRARRQPRPSEWRHRWIHTILAC